MDSSDYFRRHPFRWTVRAVLVGALSGFAMALTQPYGLKYGPISAGVGIIFSVVMYAGFTWVKNPFGRFHTRWSPGRVGVSTIAWLLLLYNALLAISIVLVRLILHVNILGNRGVLLTTALIGLAVSGFVATKETVTAMVRVERKLTQAEARAVFLALKAQLQPHTLFNALNTIASLIHESPDRAEEATLRLSDLLRTTLDALEWPEWPLKEEFRLLEDFLRLEELRFGNRLTFALELDPSMADRPIQPLLLLPLVENALKHGFRPKVGPCSLRVAAGNGRVLVQDDGVGRTEGHGDGVGLRTVRERLAASGGTLAFPPSPEGCLVEVTF